MPLEMDPEIRAKWTAALRSGDIEQAHEALRDGDGRCCLGVLCDLAVEEGVIRPPVWDDDDGWLYDGIQDVLPLSVAKWARMPSSTNNPDVPGNPGHTLAERNDEGWTFAQIADAIDGGQS